MDATPTLESPRSEWTVVSVVSAVVVGVVLAGGVLVCVTLVTASVLVGAVLATLCGGAVAGYRSRASPAIGAAVGFVVGALCGVVVLGNVLAGLGPPGTPATGSAIWVRLGLAVLGCAVTVALSSVGGALGALAR